MLKDFLDKQNRFRLQKILFVLIAIFILVLMAVLIRSYLNPGTKDQTGHSGHSETADRNAMTEADKEAEDFFAEDNEARPEKSRKEKKIAFYRNPMNPAITSSVPAKDEMGMDYIPVYEQETEGFSEDKTNSASVPGLAPVLLSGQGIELSGVVTTPAISSSFIKNIRTVGQVTLDETRIQRVQTRVSGWVEKLHVNFTGRKVEKGTPLLSIYSPILVSSQEELISTLDAWEKAGVSGTSGGGKYLQTILDASRKRLKLFDVPDAFIKELERTRKVQRTITLEAPVTGFVTSKDVFEGQKVEPGMALLTITDFSWVWVEADFYEYEISELKTGQTAQISFPYDPGLLLEGTVTYVYPYLNKDSRTLRARIEFANDNLQLKPGMFVDIGLNIDLGESITVPDSAVMYSGVRKIVFVNTKDTRFEPREVTIGARSQGKVQIISGISDGELVAVKANFLLDSESRLQFIIQNAVKEKP